MTTELVDRLTMRRARAAAAFDDLQTDSEALYLARELLRHDGFVNPTWQQLCDAVHRVFAADPELGKRYQTLPDRVAMARGRNR